MGLCAEGDCPELNLTGDIQFDGSFATITVPAGSDLNDVLLLMETYFNNTLLDLETVTYTLTAPNCIGLAAGDYNYQQLLDAVITTLCGIADSLTNPTDTNNVDLVNIVLPACFSSFTGDNATDLFNEILDRLCDLILKVNILPNAPWNRTNANDFTPFFLLKEMVDSFADNTSFMYDHTTVATSPTSLTITLQAMKGMVDGYPVYRDTTEVLTLTPNKDIYVTLDPDGVVAKIEQTIGDPAPTITGKVHLYTIETDGSGVVSYAEPFEVSAFAPVTYTPADNSISGNKLIDNTVDTSKLKDMITAATKGDDSVIKIVYNIKGQLTSVVSNMKITAVADGDMLIYDVIQGGFVNTPFVDSNFGNTDITVTANRSHDLAGYAVLFNGGGVGVDGTGSGDPSAFSVTHNGAACAVFENTAGGEAITVNDGTVRLIGTAIPTYADEAAAVIGGIATGTIYKTATGELRIKL